MNWAVDDYGHLKDLRKRINAAEKRCTKLIKNESYFTTDNANEIFGMYNDIVKLGEEYNRIARSHRYDSHNINTEGMTKKLMILQERAEDGLLACEHFL